MKTNFSTDPWRKAFLNLEWMNPIVEQFHSEDAAMLNSLSAIFCKPGHWCSLIHQYWSIVFEPFISILKRKTLASFS